MKALPEAVESWLRSFSKAVRDRDFAAGRSLFAADVVSFGTVGYRLNSLEELVSGQWQAVWPKTADFDFNYESAHVLEQEGFALVVAEWSGVGFEQNGNPFSRHGRVTLALRQFGAEWKAVHSHFSIGPTRTLS